jgi:hypothetical protein
MFEILKGGTANIPFATKERDRSLINADSLPTITGAQFAGAAVATTGMSIVQQQDSVPANITGRYYVRITNTITAGWADRGTGQIHVSAVIGGITVPEEINFVVIAASSAMPFIDVG